MNRKKYNGRRSFRDCAIFTASRSFSSIVEASDTEHLEGNPLRVLDAFAGDGLVADAISKKLSKQGRKCSITVVEINPDHIRSVSDKYKKLCLDIRNEEINGTYDLIVLRYGLHDLSQEDKEKALRNLISSLKKNGKIVISDIMPNSQSRAWLEPHHQQKEILTRGINKNVTLSSPEYYVKLLKNLGVQSNKEDSFYQEVFIQEWLETYGAPKEAVCALENLTLQVPSKIRDRFFIFNHPKRGARIYFPVVTIVGMKNE